MIKCSSCGRSIEKVPDWMQGIKADFICNNCPNRQTKNIAFIQLDAEPKAARIDDEEDIEIEDVADDDAEV